MPLSMQSRDDLPCAYLDEGKGPPLLLLHGFPLCAEMWRAQVPALARLHRVIAPDLPGLGRSPKGRSDATTMSQMASDMRSLLASLDAWPASVCGLSMGGYVALEMLRQDQGRGRVSSLILANTRCLADSEAAMAAREQTAQAVLQEGTGPLAAKMTGRLLRPSAAPALHEEVAAMIRSSSPAGVAAASRGMASRLDAGEALGAFRREVLIITSSEDALIPKAETADILRRAPPGTRHLEIPGVGHLSNLEAPEVFNQAVIDFLGSIHGLD